MANIRILSLGLPLAVREAILSPFKEIELIECNTKESLQSLMRQRPTPLFQIIFHGEEFVGFSGAEMGQTLRMTFPESSLFSIRTKTEGFDRNVLVKNGFNEAFLLPIDQNVLDEAMARSFSEAEAAIYSPVRLVDLSPGTQVDFEIRVYLSRNNKYVLYSAEGETLHKEKIDKLKLHRVNSLYVPVQQVPKFHEYSAKRLQELSGGVGHMSETERAERLKSSVRELMTGMLSESYSKNLKTGKKVIEHTRHIVDQFLMLKHPGDWQNRLLSQVGEKGDAYSHSSRTASYAVLFALALNQNNVQDLAVASMFHDLGIAELPADLQNKPVEKMTPAEFEIYKTHPELSIQVLQARHIAASDVVIQSIRQHHEKFKGGGFPNGYEGRRLSAESQILALADRFDELTRVESALTPLSPEQALRQIEREGWVKPEFIQILQESLTTPRAS